MDGSLRIGRPELAPEPRRIKRENRDGGQRRFDPSLIIEDAPPPKPDESPAAAPIGTRPDDEVGATVDVTA